MKKSINRYEFCDEFRKMNRDNNFSYKGKNALYDYLEGYEEDTGEEMELDIIALCCEFTEYENLKEFQKEYSGEYKTIEDIEERTTVIMLDDEEGFIIAQF